VVDYLIPIARAYRTRVRVFQAQLHRDESKFKKEQMRLVRVLMSRLGGLFVCLFVCLVRWRIDMLTLSPRPPSCCLPQVLGMKSELQRLQRRIRPMTAVVRHLMDDEQIGTEMKVCL